MVIILRKKLLLNGIWDFRLDEEKEGLVSHFELQPFEDTISLPATTSEAKKGRENTAVHVDHLTDPFEMTGYSWYQKKISLPLPDVQSLSGRHFELELERTRISYVWVDGVLAGSFDSFVARHCYDLTDYIHTLEPVLTIMVSNTDYKIPGGHLTSPDTQTNWNGILGEMVLYITDGLRMTDLHTDCDYEKKTALCHVKIENDSPDSVEACLGILPILCRLKSEYAAMDAAVPETADFEELVDCTELTDETGAYDIIAQPGSNPFTFRLDLSKSGKLWDEEEPCLYQLAINLSYGKPDAGEACIADTKTIFFGLCSFTAGGSNFYINGRKTFLRGKHEGMIFPLTGYAPMNLGGWLRVMKTSQNFGINHYRFHTCCPPEAAFLAADLLGIYMEPEIPFWGNFYGPDDQEYQKEMQEFLEMEGFRMLESFSDHPSYRMMSMGNELWGNKDAINALLEKYKRFRPQILYSQGSNNFQWTPNILPADDFFCGVRLGKDRLIRGSYAMCDKPQGHVQTREPNTCYNYDVQKDLIPEIPVISHEIGQYEVYPDYTELEKYVGVLKPWNLKEFQRRLGEKNLLPMAEDYFRCSGALAVACYKNELESALRSEFLAGFQILDIQDFTGQGTALVGVLNAFMENKGLISAPCWRRFCSDAVLQAEFESFLVTSGENMDITISLSYFRKESLPSCQLSCHMTDQKGNTAGIYEESIAPVTEKGRHLFGRVTFPIKEISSPEKWRLSVRLSGTEIQNQYTLWAYPASMRKGEEKGAKAIDAEAILPKRRESGLVAYHCRDAFENAKSADVCLLFLNHAENENSIEGTYCTDFWCYPMFQSISLQMGKEVPVGTMGLLIRKEHPALASFPCESYTTPQWYSIVNASRSTILDGTDIVPIVQTIDNFERNHRLGLLYEVYLADLDLVLLVCTSDLPALCRDGYPEARALYESLLGSLPALGKSKDKLCQMTSQRFTELLKGEG